eukprot:jgi/Bigna1/70589/fgenesh1_pg.12_\
MPTQSPEFVDDDDFWDDFLAFDIEQPDDGKFPGPPIFEQLPPPKKETESPMRPPLRKRQRRDPSELRPTFVGCLEFQEALWGCSLCTTKSQASKRARAEPLERAMSFSQHAMRGSNVLHDWQAAPMASSTNGAPRSDCSKDDSKSKEHAFSQAAPRAESFRTFFRAAKQPPCTRNPLTEKNPLQREPTMRSLHARLLRSTQPLHLPRDSAHHNPKSSNEQPANPAMTSSFAQSTKQFCLQKLKLAPFAVTVFESAVHRHPEPLLLLNSMVDFKDLGLSERAKAGLKCSRRNQRPLETPPAATLTITLVERSAPVGNALLTAPWQHDPVLAQASIDLRTRASSLATLIEIIEGKVAELPVGTLRATEASFRELDGRDIVLTFKFHCRCLEPACNFEPHPGKCGVLLLPPTLCGAMSEGSAGCTPSQSSEEGEFVDNDDFKDDFIAFDLEQADDKEFPGPPVFEQFPPPQEEAKSPRPPPLKRQRHDSPCPPTPSPTTSWSPLLVGSEDFQEALWEDHVERGSDAATTTAKAKEHREAQAKAHTATQVAPERTCTKSALFSEQHPGQEVPELSFDWQPVPRVSSGVEFCACVPFVRSQFALITSPPAHNTSRPRGTELKIPTDRRLQATRKEQKPQTTKIPKPQKTKQKQRKPKRTERLTMTKVDNNSRPTLENNEDKQPTSTTPAETLQEVVTQPTPRARPTHDDGDEAHRHSDTSPQQACASVPPVQKHAACLDHEIKDDGPAAAVLHANGFNDALHHCAMPVAAEPPKVIVSPIRETRRRLPPSSSTSCTHTSPRSHLIHHRCLPAGRAFADCFHRCPFFGRCSQISRIGQIQLLAGHFPFASTCSEPVRTTTSSSSTLTLVREEALDDDELTDDAEELDFLVERRSLLPMRSPSTSSGPMTSVSLFDVESHVEQLEDEAVDAGAEAEGADIGDGADVSVSGMRTMPARMNVQGFYSDLHTRLVENMEELRAMRDSFKAKAEMASKAVETTRTLVPREVYLRDDSKHSSLGRQMEQMIQANIDSTGTSEAGIAADMREQKQALQISMSEPELEEEETEAGGAAISSTSAPLDRSIPPDGGEGLALKSDRKLGINDGEDHGAVEGEKDNDGDDDDVGDIDAVPEEKKEIVTPAEKNVVSRRAFQPIAAEYDT